MEFMHAKDHTLMYAVYELLPLSFNFSICTAVVFLRQDMQNYREKFY
jgi:hypothetical protein